MLKLLSSQGGAGAEMSNWKFVHIGHESNDCRIGGLAVWKPESRSSHWKTGRGVFFPLKDYDVWRPVEVPAVRLPHPQYPNQIHDFNVYEIGEPDCPVRFAACELSNGVWGFYVPD